MSHGALASIAVASVAQLESQAYSRNCWDANVWLNNISGRLPCGTLMVSCTRQARREELQQTVQTLERLLEQGNAEHSQLRADRDTLADCVCSLQELQQQPPALTNTPAPVRVWDLTAERCHVLCREQPY